MARKYQRKTFLINPNFQLRVSFYIATWLLPLSLLAPAIYYNKYEYLIKYAKDHSILEMVDLLEKQRSLVTGELILVQAVLMVITFLISLYMSHKIAGPLHKLHTAFSRAKKGHFTEGLRFRTSDHFQELSEDFNDMVSTVRGMVDQNVETVSTAIARIETAMADTQGKGKEELEQALTELRKIRERFSI